MMDPQAVQRVARALFEARFSRVPVAAVPDATEDDAIPVRTALLELITEGGAKPIVAYKVAGGNAWGSFTADMVEASGARVSRSAFLNPLVEAEVGFRLEADIDPGMSVRDVLENASVTVTLEIADGRWASWNPVAPVFVPPSAFEALADNGFASRLVVGGFQPAILLDPESLLRLEADGRVLGEGPVKQVRGHPANAVLLLARHLADLGQVLRRGVVVSPGCPITTLFPLAADARGTYSAILGDQLSATAEFVD